MDMLLEVSKASSAKGVDSSEVKIKVEIVYELTDGQSNLKNYKSSCSNYRYNVWFVPYVI